MDGIHANIQELVASERYARSPQPLCDGNGPLAASGSTGGHQAAGDLGESRAALAQDGVGLRAE